MDREDEYVEAAREGKDAADMGKPEDACPYEWPTQLAHAWHLGWQLRQPWDKKTGAGK